MDGPSSIISVTRHNEVEGGLALTRCDQGTAAQRRALAIDGIAFGDWLLEGALDGNGHILGSVPEGDF